MKNHGLSTAACRIAGVLGLACAPALLWANAQNETWPVMIDVRGGEFLMGCFGGPACAQNQRPSVHIRIDPFAISETEVTVRQWAACVDAGACQVAPQPRRPLADADYPVVSVSWEDTQDYVRWLSDQTGQTYRLPSEAEWEYASRAGAPLIPAKRVRCERCNGMEEERIRPVASQVSNSFALHDLRGNVWEWVQDCWRDNYEGAQGDGRPHRPEACARRVIRGLAWDVEGDFLASTDRLRQLPDFRLNRLGFRVVRELQ
ncbi:MAG: formylglycine-generating enzyme family protein [Gammaproteobacteria bacterium]|nr:formylglycine-generating enzyme family protein [Gammaproteobacteria bacterium]